ncbi:hypothetical protein TVAG_475840 [Trichomonas vaginalis G3]|uniref:Uncharacterized protein n=1 Tax=Trichomonas vaginalis (strain ATCC PRA-98 / G3) TaxID=412133 RepID=A2DA08_TRIV3|nr:chondroitin AC/alginate lyase family protein family [Trichomonas vaginalis G3]EAY22656.1 hypothetical protein TVAG_475840 [Trichomonas vaginalis G3]KAI5525470.1 chondroitin AC/alginate lyase family protein family [Trichomonas vaginalis G3]|eukprot:XP_001583642.1 hypothetical protein [Trichomonas vaginalis G3]
MKDNIIGGENPQRMVWTMTTPSNVTVVDAKTVTLTQGTKSCTLKILNPPDGEISVADNVPPHDYDEPSDGSMRVLIKSTVNSAETKQYRVTLTPSSQ